MANNKFILDVDVKPLKLQLREATLELQRAQQKFGDYSQAAIDASKKVAAIKDAMQDAAESAKLFDPGSRFQAVTTFASQAAAGVSAFQGAMALLGTESKDVEKTLLKVQGAMALSQGLSELKDVGKSFRELGITAKDAIKTFTSSAVIGATKATNAIFKALGMSVSTASLSFKALRATIISTGIGALVVAIGYAINALMDWYDNTKKQEEANKNLKTADELLADQIEETNKRIEDRIAINEFSRNKEVILAKARGESIQQIRKIEDKYYQESLFTLEKSYEQKTRALTDFLEKELTTIGIGQDEIDLVTNNWYNEGLVNLNTYYAMFNETTRKQYDLLKKDIQKGEEDKYKANQEYSILEANRQLEDYNKAKERRDKANEKAEQDRQKLAEKQKEAEQVIFDARKSLLDKFAAEELEINKQYEEDVKKIQDAKFKDKKKETEALLLVEKERDKKLREVDNERRKEQATKEKEAKEKARAFENELADIRYETAQTGVKNQYEMERAELLKSYQDKMKDIMANEEYTFIQKFILLSALQQRYKAQSKATDDAEQLEKDMKFAAELEEIALRDDILLNQRQEALNKENEIFKLAYEQKKITEEEYIDFKKRSAQTQATIDQSRLDQQLMFADAVGQIFGTISSMMGEGTAEYKAFAVAEAIISTYVSIAKTLGAFSNKPIPGYAIAQAIATGVFGFAQVKKIMETKIPEDKGGSSGGNVASIGGAGSVSAPQVPQLQTITNTPINAVFDSLNSRQEPIRAFVVESEITANQNRVSDIERRSRF
jgi:hypothetical protein